MERLINHAPVSPYKPTANCRESALPALCRLIACTVCAQVRGQGPVMGRAAAARPTVGLLGSVRSSEGCHSDPFTDIPPVRRPLHSAENRAQHNKRSLSSGAVPSRPSKASKLAPTQSRTARNDFEQEESRQRSSSRRTVIAVNYSEKAQQRAACGRGGSARDQRPDESGGAYRRRLASSLSAGRSASADLINVGGDTTSLGTPARQASAADHQDAAAGQDADDSAVATSRQQTAGGDGETLAKASTPGEDRASNGLLAGVGEGTSADTSRSTEALAVPSTRALRNVEGTATQPQLATDFGTSTGTAAAAACSRLQMVESTAEYSAVSGAKPSCGVAAHKSSSVTQQPSQLALLLANETGQWAQCQETAEKSRRVGEVLSLLAERLDDLLARQRVQIHCAGTSIARTQQLQSEVKKQQEDALQWVDTACRNNDSAIDSIDESAAVGASPLPSGAFRIFESLNDDAAGADDDLTGGRDASATQNAIDEFSNCIKLTASKRLQHLSSLLTKQQSQQVELNEEHTQQLNLFHSKAIADIAVTLAKGAWAEAEPPSAESCESRLSHLMYAELLAWHDADHNSGSNDSDNGSDNTADDRRLNMPVLLAQTLAHHGQEQEHLLQEQCVQYTEQCSAVQAAQKALQAAQVEKVTLARLLKQNLMSAASASDPSAQLRTRLVSSGTVAATDQDNTAADHRRQNCEPDQTETCGDKIVVSEEMLHSSIFAPFEEAADSRIARKQADLQFQLARQAKLSAVHATARERHARDTIGE